MDYIKAPFRPEGTPFAEFRRILLQTAVARHVDTRMRFPGNCGCSLRVNMLHWAPNEV